MESKGGHLRENMNNEIQPAQFPTEPKRHTGLILLIIGILILVVVVVVFIARPEKAEEIAILEPKLTANVVFASTINLDYSYEPQPSAEYIEGDALYVYVAVEGAKKINSRIDVVEDLEIKDSTGKTVFVKAGFGSIKQAVGNSPLIEFSNVVPTTDWVEGVYSLRIRITDNVGGESIEKTMQFSIKEKSSEVVEANVNLNEVVSDDLAQTQLIKQQTVWDPQGNVIQELTFNQTVVTDLSGLDLSNIDSQFRIPERFDAGVYTVEVKYINLENGKSVSVKDTVTVVKTLDISEFVFASFIDDNYIYEVQPNAVYSVGDTIYVYLKLVDFAQPETNGKFMINITEKLELLDTEGYGITFMSEPNYLIVNDLNVIKRDSYSIKNGIVSSGLSTGSYNVKITIKDLNSGQEAVREGVFKVE